MAGREREAKLAAWAGFRLPPLDGVVEGVQASPATVRNLNAVYYDTPDLRLARWGVTVRHRSGEGDGWTVKLPEGEDGPALVRRELTFEGRASSIPAGVLDLVRAYVRTATLAPVAHLRTRRTGVQLRDVEGQEVAEVVDDEVSVLEGRRLVARFREVEVEVQRRAHQSLMPAVIDRLRQAGAGEPERVPKVVRALGARATEPPELVPVPIDEDASVADVVRAAVVASVTRILQHDPGVRLGDDAEDVHQARVGTRRLRSDLRTFRPVLVREWSEPLRDELKWLADALGRVRDPDVLLERLRRQAASLPDVGAAGPAPLMRQLAAERERARAELLEALGSDRYVVLLDQLVEGAQAPAVRPEADEPARKVVPELVARPWRHLAKAVQDLPADPPADDLHQVRILAKRARYAAEAASPVVGKQARSMAKGVAELQTVLGDHQDATVAEEWLREAVNGAGPAEALVAGELIALQHVEAAACRQAWRAAWKQASKKKHRAWLS